LEGMEEKVNPVRKPIRPVEDAENVRGGKKSLEREGMETVEVYGVFSGKKDSGSVEKNPKEGEMKKVR